MDMGSYVLSFAALSFLGIGVEVGYADWGQRIALVLFVLAWNLVGDALRDILDPRLRGRGGI